MNPPRKYTVQGSSPYPHIGKLIEQKMKEKRIRKSEVARILDITPPVMQAYLQQPSVQFGILWKIGLAIDHNFLADLMAHLPQNVLNSNDSVFQQTIKEQAKEIEDLKKENAIYKALLVKH